MTPGDDGVRGSGVTTEVLVLRHGQSEWNALGRWQGQENPPLTDLGREQAVEAAQAVGTVDAVFASPLDRAARTAGIIYALERALGAEFDKIGNLAGRRFLHRNDGFDLGERVHLLVEETVPSQI